MAAPIRALGDQPLFGGQHVWAPAQQVGRAVARGQAGRGGEVSVVGQFGAPGSGLCAHQHVEPVLFSVEAGP
jgi:hypothetical protein